MVHAAGVALGDEVVVGLAVGVSLDAVEVAFTGYGGLLGELAQPLSEKAATSAMEPMKTLLLPIASA